MKTSRFRHSYRDSASKYHKAVGDLLRASKIFGDFEIYQEYPVNRVCKNYPDSRHHYDWVIPKLKLVFEVNGHQHYEPVAFDGDWETAQVRFESQKERDEQKRLAAISSGFLYIEVPYHIVDQPDWNELSIWERIDVAKDCQPEYTGEVFKKKDEVELYKKLKEERDWAAKMHRKKQKESEAHKALLEAAREYRQKRYKELKNAR